MTAVDVSPEGTHVVFSTCAYPTRPGFTYTPSTRHGTDADGNPIIFIDSVDPNPELLNYDHELVRARIDDSEPQRLTTNPRFDNYPAWSPDGTRIAYVSATASAAEAARISIMSADGTDTRRPKVGLASVALHPPAWSPDGNWLAVTGSHGLQGLAIHIAAADGQGFRRLTNAVSGASWSPDGQRLAFAKPEPEEDAVALYTIAVDGTDARRLATIPGRSWHPQYGEPDPTRAWIETVAWSPDGSKILYSCAPAICVVSLDGSPVSVTPLPGNAAAWSPDGSRIAILNTEFHPPLQTVAPDGSNLRLLVIEHEDGLQAVAPRPVDEPGDVAGCSAGTAVPQPDANPGLVQDCETLLIVQAQLAGARRLGWATNRPITEWQGVVLGDRPLRVRRLTLAGLGLRGGIPPELARLTQLSRLDLSQNGFGGKIPPELGALSELRVLELGRNFLVGAIPAELAGLTKLRDLNLQGNYLTGCIPRGIRPKAVARFPDLPHCLAA